MCFFKKKLKFPHPEELVNPLQDVEIRNVVMDWLYTWGVDTEYWSYWLEEVKIEFSNKYDCPAWTLGNEIGINPGWANPGILSHEACHVIFPLIDSEEFAVSLGVELLRDKLLQKLYNEKLWRDSNIVEQHAECFRYIGQELPEELHQFYPKLLI